MKAAIIGCGHVASQHIRQLKKNSEVQIVSVCDIDPQKASHYANHLGMEKYFTDVDQLLKECVPNVVHILTPPQSHKELTIKCINAGCHVLVEKPFSINADEAEHMVKTAESANVKIAVCHNFLFVPAVIHAKKMVDEGKLGEIVFAEVFWRVSRQGENDRYHKAKWVYDLDGGIAHEIAAHPVYLLRAFLGDLNVRGVNLMNRETDLPHPVNDLQVMLDSKTALAAFTISVNSQPTEKYLRILGTKCSVHIDLGTNTMIKLNPISQGNLGKVLSNFNRASQYVFQTTKNILLSISGRLPHGHDTLIKQFYSSLKGELPNPIPGEDGLAVVSILDQIWNNRSEKS